MRPSNRSKILEAAADVVQREGVTSVTLDSVAAEAGITKGGLLYHFPTRDALILAIQQHLAAIWEENMLAVLGKPYADATPQERVTAYAVVTTSSTTRAELLFLLESSTTPDYRAPWTEVLDRWTPHITDEKPTPDILAQTVARLAAEGLWLHESISGERVHPEIRALITEQIVNGISSNRALPSELQD